MLRRQGQEAFDRRAARGDAVELRIGQADAEVPDRVTALDGLDLSVNWRSAATAMGRAAPLRFRLKRTLLILLVYVCFHGWRLGVLIVFCSGQYKKAL